MDDIIKIFNINNNNYEVLQTLIYHRYYIVNKIIELKNCKLVSCSSDSSIIIYSKDNNKYIIDYLINTNVNYICFYDLLKNKVINKIKVFHISSN